VVACRRTTIGEAEGYHVFDIVFHVIHDGDKGKLSEAQVNDQLTVLNDAFSGTRDDSAIDTQVRAPRARNAWCACGVATVGPVPDELGHQKMARGLDRLGGGKNREWRCLAGSVVHARTRPCMHVPMATARAGRGLS